MKRKLLFLTALITISFGINAQNLIVDGDFESNDLSVWNAQGSYGITITDTDANSGIYSASFATWSSALAQTITVEPGATYRISLSAKWTASTGAGLKMVVKDNATKTKIYETTPIKYSTEWATIIEYYTIPAGVTELLVNMWTGNVPAVLVDDVSISKYTEQRIKDGDFEAGDLVNGGWNLNVPKFSHHAALETTDVYEGANSGNLLLGATWGSALIQVFDVIPGHTYEVSFAAKWPEGVASENGINMNFKNYATDGAIYTTENIATSDWSTLKDSMTIPVGVNELKLIMWKKPAATTYCLVDNVSVLDLGSITPLIAVSDNGDIVEGAEDGKIITLSVVNDTLVNTLTLANYFATGLPSGVSFGAVNRVDDVTAEITLSGNTTQDYDTNITNIEVFVSVNEFIHAKDTLSAKGITFQGIDEKITLTGEILEDFEDGDTITVSVENNTFVATPNFSNWTVTNLPEGVTLGSVNFVDEQTIVLKLSGNTTGDYDTDITNTTVTVAPPEFTLARDAVSANSGVKFIAAIEGGEVLLWEDNFNSYADGTDLTDTSDIVDYGFSWFNMKSATVTGGEAYVELNTYVNWSEDSANHWFMKTYVVEPGKTYKYVADSRTDDNVNTVLTAMLGGKTQFKTDPSKSTVWRTRSVILTPTDQEHDTVNLAFYRWGNGGHIYVDNMKLYELTDPAITISDDGEIKEGAEDGEIITVLVGNDTYVATLTPANWSISNLPEGVSIGTVTRTDDTHVQISLSGNATADYDVDIIDCSVSATRDEFVTSNKGLSVAEGITLTAIVEVPTISIADDGEILEGAEDGEIITVTLSLDTFVDPITPANYTLANRPAGVSIGFVNRVDDTTVEIYLSGNATADYSVDITNATLTITGDEFTTSSETLVSSGTGVTFTALDPSGISSLGVDGLKVYPNPVVEELQISASSKISDIQIFNMQGALIYKMINIDSEQTKIAFGHWNAGLYLVSIKDIYGNTNNGKIIKE